MRAADRIPTVRLVHSCKTPARHSVLCPVCRAEGRVYGGRRDGDMRIRNRRCDREGCGQRWLTIEGGEVQEQVALVRALQTENKSLRGRLTELKRRIWDAYSVAEGGAEP